MFASFTRHVAIRAKEAEVFDNFTMSLQHEKSLLSLLNSLQCEIFPKKELDNQDSQFLEFLQHTVVRFEPRSKVEFKVDDTKLGYDEEDIARCIEAFTDTFAFKGCNGTRSSNTMKMNDEGRINFSLDSIRRPFWNRFCYLFGCINFVSAIECAEYFMTSFLHTQWIFVKKQTYSQTSSNAPLTKSRMMYCCTDELKKKRVIPESCDKLLRMIDCSTDHPTGMKQKRLRTLKAILRQAKNNDENMNYDLLYRSKVRARNELPETRFSEVVTFVIAAIDNIFPPYVMGTSLNKRRFHNFLIAYLKSQKRTNLSITALIKSMDLNSMKWLGRSGRVLSSPDKRFKEPLLHKFLKWIFCTIVSRIVRSYWYVTETSGRAPSQGSIVAFIPHEEWRNTSGSWMNQYIKKYLTKVLRRPSLESRYKEGALRLVPKTNDFRPLCIPLRYLLLPKAERLLPEEIRESYKFTKCILGPIRDMIRYQQAKKSVFRFPGHVKCLSSRDVVKAICSFRSSIVSSPTEEKLEFFAMKFDMKHCYDNLNQAKVFQCVRDLFSGEEENSLLFTNFQGFRASSTLYPKSLKLVSDQHTIEKLKRVECLKRGAILNGNYQSKASMSKFKVLEILDIVLDQVVEGRIRIKGADTYTRKIGVFQGTPLLATFCDVLYDRLICETFQYLSDTTNSLLIRLADDFLVISQDKLICHKVFEDACSDKFKQFGAYVNLEKSQLYDPKHEKPIKFVGLEISLQSLEVLRKVAVTLSPPLKHYQSLQQVLEWYSDVFAFKILDVLTRSINVRLQDLKEVVEHVFKNLESHLRKVSTGSFFLAEDLDVFTGLVLQSIFEKMNHSQMNDLSAALENDVLKRMNKFKRMFCQ